MSASAVQTKSPLLTASSADQQRESIIARLREYQKALDQIANDSYDCVLVVCCDIASEHMNMAAQWLQGQIYTEQIAKEALKEQA